MKVTKYRFGDLLKKLNADIPSDFGDDYDDDLTHDLEACDFQPTKRG